MSSLVSTGQKSKQWLGKTAKYTVLLFVALMWVIPYIWMIGASFKSDEDITISYFTLFPEDPTLESYQRAIETLKIHFYILNSFIVSISAVVLQTAVCALAAFALARLNLPGAGVLLLAFIATMMVPEEAMMVPLFLLLRGLRLINTYRGMILPLIPWGFSVYVLSEFFKQIPKEIEESAIVDGCPIFKIFIRIILPLARPALGAVLIFSFIMTWDQLVIPLLVITKQSMMTVPLGLANSAQHEAGENHAMLAAATVIATLPSILIFIAFQRQFIRGMTMGSLKG